MFFSRFLPQIPPVEYLNAVKTCFHGIEVGLDPLFKIDLLDSSAGIKMLKDYAREWNMAFTVHASFFRVCLGHPQKSVRDRSAQDILYAMETAELLGAQKIIIHPSVFTQGEHHTRLAEVMKYEEESLFELCRIASGRGLILCMENMPREDVFPQSVMDATRLIYLCSLMPRKAFGLTIDIGHALQAGIDILPLLPKLAPYIEHFHLHDNDGSFDQHRPFLDIHDSFWKSFSQVIREINYRGSYCVEVKDLQGQIQAIEKIKTWFG